MGATGTGGMSAYEQEASREVAAWHARESGTVGRVIAGLGGPLRGVLGRVVGTPLFESVVGGAARGLLGLVNDLAQSTVQERAVFARFRERGHDVTAHADLHRLDLSEPDELSARLAPKYVALLALEGGAAGMAGAPGLAVDVPSVLVGSLRAVAEHATHYGFDVKLPVERLYALQVLAVVSAATDDARRAALEQLATLAGDISGRRARDTLDAHVTARVAREASQALGMALTRRKLGQSVPVVGAAVGGGYNAWFADRVCEAATMLYRERFLARKYGLPLGGSDDVPAAVEVLSVVRDER